MKLLLDTQIVHMLVGRQDRLSAAERRVIDDAHNSVTVSAVSLWELRIKWHASYRSGTRKGEVDPSNVVDAFKQLGLPVARLPLTFEHCMASLNYSINHNDPFDRLLLIQAQVEGMRLLTRDSQLENHPLALYA